MNDNPKPGKNGFKFPEHSIKTKITDVKPNELVTLVRMVLNFLNTA